MALPLDKLARSLRSLQQTAASSPGTTTLTRKPIDKNGRVKVELQRVKATFQATDLSTSEARGVVSKIMHILVEFLQHSDENLRSLAYETFLALSRHLILIGHENRLLLILISELGEEPQARSATALVTTLSKVIRLAKPKRLELFSTHILTAIEELLHRPEEALHLALIANLPTLFKTIGPVLDKLSIPKKDTTLEFEKWSLAMKMLNSLLSRCLDGRGSSSRSAITAILNLATHSTKCFDKTLRFCTDSLNSLDDQTNPIRLAASINILKGLYNIMATDESRRERANVRKIVCLLLCLTHSSVNEVLIASFECLNTIFPLLSREQLSFYPPDVLLSPEGPSIESSITNLSTATSSPFLPRRILNETNHSMPASINSSLADIPSRIGGSTADFDQLSIMTSDSMLNGSDSAASPSNSWDSRETNEEDNSEIIDPLINAELYEEELSRRVDEDVESGPISPSTSSTVLERLPDIFSNDPQKPSISLPEYTIFLIAYRFLLQEESQGLIPDLKVRVSHKMLALSLLTNCAAHSSKVLTLCAPIAGKHQSLHSLTDLIYHSDDKLSALAVNFIATSQSAAGENADEKKCREWFGFVWSRLSGKNLAATRRSLLLAITEKQEMMERIGLVEKAIILATTSTSINYGQLKTSMASFLCSLDWSRLSSSIRSSHQLPSLDCLIDLLAEKDPHVVAVVAQNLPKFDDKADFGGGVDHFMLNLPENPMTAYNSVPMVLGLPSTFDFTPSSHLKTKEKTLALVLLRLFNRLTSYRDAGLSDPTSIDQLPGLISALSSLSSSFPPSIYSHGWSSVSTHSHGLLSLLVDIADSSVHSPSFLSKLLRLQASIIGGHFSNLITDIIGDKRSAKERDAIPPLADTVLYERLFLMPIRVLNVYYCIAEDRRQELSGRQSLAMGQKPVKELRGTERISSYARLVQTGIVVTKPTAFCESPSLYGIVPQLRGAFRNYLDSVDEEHEGKMIELMDGAVSLFSTLLEMHSLHSIRPLIPELMLYVDALTPFSPLCMARLSTQLLKSIFGRNAQTLNIGYLKSLRTQKGEEIKSDYDVAEFLLSSELQSMRSRLKDKEQIMNSCKSHFGWIASNTTVIAPAPTTEVNTALRYFESFITQVVAMYGSVTDVETKKSMLNLFIQLRLSGIEFDLVDPTKKVVGAVEEQLGHGIYSDMMREVFSFLILLARSSAIKWSVLKLHALALVTSIEENKEKSRILDGLELVLHEFFCIRGEVPTEITSLLFNSSSSLTLLTHCPAKYLQLFHMYLNTKENDEESFHTTSVILFKQLTSIFQLPSLPEAWELIDNCSSLLSSLLLVFSQFPPSSLMPIDDFAALVKAVVLHPSMNTEREKYHAPRGIIMLTPLIFLIFSEIIDEDRFIHRIEGYFEKDATSRVAGLFRPLARYLRSTIEVMMKERPEDLRKDDLTVFRAAALILRTITTSTHPLLLEQFILCCYEEGLLTPSLLTVVDRLTPEWMLLLTQFKENERVSNLFFETFEKTQIRANHRYLVSLSIQILVRFLGQNGEVKEMKERIILSGLRGDMQIELMRAARQSKEDEEKFVRSLQPAIAQKFVNAALKYADAQPFQTQVLSVISTFVRIYNQKNGKILVSIARPKTVRHRRRADKPSNLLVADSSFELLVIAVSNADGFPPSLTPAVLEMREAEMERFVRIIFKKNLFSKFISTVLISAATLITKAAADITSLARLRNSTALFLKCLINIEEIQEDHIISIFANINPLILLRVETSILDENVEETGRMVGVFVRRLKGRLDLDETLAALRYFLQHPSTTATFSANPLSNLSLIHDLLCCLLSIIERRSGMEYPSRARSEIFSVFGIDIESKEYDELFDLFHMSQFMMSLFSRRLISSSDPLGITIRSLFRLPIINGFALTPKTALDGGWIPGFEVQGKTISVPLPPIHKLNDMDVLDDFTWRCLFLGWTSRQQFESVWVSLVGVLSSTPSGDELRSEMALDTVLVSSLAIRRLTSFLLLTQLEPQPGNPIESRFRSPSRENQSTFRDHQNYHSLAQLLADLSIDRHATPIINRSIEFSIGSRENQSVFHLNQFGTAELWTHVGLIEEKPSQPSSLRPTSTLFLDQLRIELDAASAVRSLYENFSHWFSRGIDVIPIELITETLRAMAVLCDLFEDVPSFDSLDVDMRMLAHSSYLTQGDELGFILLAQSKAVAVIGQEVFSEDQWKKLQSLVLTGLDHRRSGVRCNTIRGLLFLFQSSTAEGMTEMVKNVVDWSIRELDIMMQETADLIFNTGEHSSIEYRNLVWALIFRLIEHPSRVPAKSRLFQMVIDVYLSSSPSSQWQMEALSIGLTSLVLHSQTFAMPALRTALNSLDKFSSHPSRLHFGLRLLAVAVHREPEVLKDFKSSLGGLIETSRMCEVNEVKQIVTTIVAMKRMDENDLEILHWLTSLIFTPSSRPHPQPASLIESLSLLTPSLRSTQVEAGLLDLSRDLIASSQSRQRVVVLSLSLAATSPFSQFVHLYESLRPFHSSTSTSEWEAFLRHYRDIVSA